ncbi:Uncharacterised protein [Vibrio cholerae]|nr:Uncharacterised protein [Vibrio cholerae]CSC70093.1 Uncharacterised protein [Vibrio cholerae]CSI42812.1 Uncharacterised protein [Vibrio cholerae]
MQDEKTPLSCGHSLADPTQPERLAAASRWFALIRHRGTLRRGLG